MSARPSVLRLVEATVIGLVAVMPSDAGAIPAFARKYNVSCALCHAPFPRLTAVGEAFAGNGFQFTLGEEPRDTTNTGDALLRLQRNLPLAVRFDSYVRTLTNAGESQRSTDIQTPWVVKLLSGGQVAEKVSYYMYFLLSERGEVAGLEDAYVQFTDIGGSGVSLVVGQFQVSDPLFKRELRLSYEDYQPYRVRVGEAQNDLTYDRGLMALFSPWSGADVAVEVVTGQGLRAATKARDYDRDNARSGVVRFSQELGPIRLGVFGYRGAEMLGGIRNRTNVWGPDATIPLASVGEVNVQYLRRTDDDPFFGSCSVVDPCPGNRTAPFRTKVNSAVAEVIVWPQGPDGRLFLNGTFNWIAADDPVVSLRLGEQETTAGYLSRYNTMTAGVHYLHRRNVRFLGELGWDAEQEQARLVFGTVLAF